MGIDSGVRSGVLSKVKKKLVQATRDTKLWRGEPLPMSIMDAAHRERSN